MQPISRVAVLAALGLAALGVVLAADGAVSTTSAQGYWRGQGSSYPYSRQRYRSPYERYPAAARRAPVPKPSAEERAALKATASGPLLAVVSLANQRMTVYDGTGPIIRTPISSGMSGHPTPTGVFSVLQKNRHHRSNIYSGAPMPYMQRLTWSGIALHAGALPGYPASHGCIRLPFPVAARLFAMSRMGMRVIVAPSEATPAVFSHPALPEPAMVTAEVRAEAPLEPIKVATAEGQGSEAAAAAAMPRRLNPMQAAQAERLRARLRVTDATRANKELLEESRRISGEANAALAVARAAATQVGVLRARLDRETAEEARADLARQVAEAETAAAAAETFARDRDKAAYDAARASRDAEDALAAAEEARRIAERGTEPIAVFISRKEGKVMVRQGMVPLFEAPVTIKEPDQPLGTHVFQVLAADDATGQLTWKAVTVPETSSFGRNSDFDNRGPVRRGERTVRRPAAPSMPSDAKGALERVEMDEDVRKRIAERLWLNGSITISDHGISNETGKGTDFVVLTR